MSPRLSFKNIDFDKYCQLKIDEKAGFVNIISIRKIQFKVFVIYGISKMDFNVLRTKIVRL